MGSSSISSRLVQFPSEPWISSLSMVMLRCARSAGASITLTVKVPLLEARLGHRSDGNLKPATARLPMMRTAIRTPMAVKNPTSRMLSDICLCSLSDRTEPFSQRLI